LLQVFIHSPQGRSLGSSQAASGRAVASKGHQELIHLNIGQRVTALNAGRLDPAPGGRDCLLVGTPTNLLAYDVEENADLFHKDVQDGVNAVKRLLYCFVQRIWFKLVNNRFFFNNLKYYL